MLLHIAQQHDGIEPFLETFFGFLRRKTDFFSSASKDQVKKVLMSAVDKQYALVERTETEKALAREAEEKKRIERIEKQKKEESEARNKKKKEQAQVKKVEPPQEEEDVIELGSDGTFDLTANKPQPKTTETESKEEEKPVPKQDKKEESNDESEDKEDDSEKDDGKIPVNDALGGDLENYNWGQTLNEITMNVPVPPGTASRDLKVVIERNSLKIAIKGQQPIISGEFYKSVQPDDCIWTLVERRELVITLQKTTGHEWWPCVIKGHPEINTTKINPPTSKLNDLDGETRQHVEKMMFDTRQKQMGLPTSDELQKQELLNKFMKQHPEMDFSQAKFM